jgi:predicted enzyme related to lactoylglutathione lyase
MKTRRMDLTISTNKMQQSKDFYMKYLGFELVFESDWYIELLAEGSDNMGVSFVMPEQEAGEKFTGKGMILSFEVEDVDAEYEKMKIAGLMILERIKDKPWGERSFVINDPNGVHIYIYKAIPPTPEYQKVYDSFKK